MAQAQVAKAARDRDAAKKAMDAAKKAMDAATREFQRRIVGPLSGLTNPFRFKQIEQELRDKMDNTAIAYRQAVNVYLARQDVARLLSDDAAKEVAKAIELRQVADAAAAKTGTPH